MDFIHSSTREDTIAALATPPGMGGIAVVRVSGKKAINSVGKLAQKDLSEQTSHTAVLRTVHFKEGVDKALILIMKAPRSFTGEDIVEIHCHGGHLVAKCIMHELSKVGVRPAEPGEFSLRAFLAGKIDLAQAEAIQDLVGARNEEALRVAGEQLEGKLSRHVKAFQEQATDLAAIFEAWVDFPEDDLGFCTFDDALEQLKGLKNGIEKLLRSFHTGRIVHDGISLCIVGAPNVGKSSLMNALLGHGRAIVSPIAGTTRDIVEDDLRLKKLHCKLVDTAGIREAHDEIEQEGVRRSWEAMGRADVILAVLDASRPDDQALQRPLEGIPREKSLLIWNKIDLVQKRPLPTHGFHHVQEVSSTTFQGIEHLGDEIEGFVLGGDLPSKEEVMITNVRHRSALEEALKATQRVISGIETSLSPEFIALEMRDVLLSLGEIIGTNITEDILSAIFSKFCIGK